MGGVNIDVIEWRLDCFVIIEQYLYYFSDKMYVCAKLTNNTASDKYYF